MVIDTSAIVAILLDEPERSRFARAIEADPRRVVSAVTLVEATMVLERRFGGPGGLRLDRLLKEAAVEIEAVTVGQAEIARDAFRRNDRGRHAARLNFGDIFAYALAKATGEPLLFKGKDFVHTDITGAV